MNKIAQRRSLLNQIREKVNMPGSYLEGFFKPELDRVMVSLKELDDRIRAELSGKQIGDAEAPADAISAKDLLKNARQNFNRREYMAGVADLGRFHKKMYLISQAINGFFVDVNKIHHKFLFEGLPENQQTNLKQLREHMEGLNKKSTQDNYLVKSAGIMDFFYQVGTKRGRGLAAWEKKYPKQTKDLREGGNRLVNEAQKLLDNTLTYLRQMATARATRRPDEYMDVASKIKQDFDKFDGGDKGFRVYYNSAIVPWLKIKDEIEAKEQAAQPVQKTEEPTNSNENKTELGEEPTLTRPPSVPATPAALKVQQPFPAAAPVELAEEDAPTERNLPVAEPAKLPAPVRPAPPADPQLSLPGTTYTWPAVLTPEQSSQANLPGIEAHQSFYRSLQSMSQESPLVLAGVIARYASSIQASDPETALSLFSVAKNIRG